MTGPLQIVLGTISVLFLIVASVMAYRAVRVVDPQQSPNTEHGQA